MKRALKNEAENAENKSKKNKISVEEWNKKITSTTMGYVIHHGNIIVQPVLDYYNRTFNQEKETSVD